MRAHVLFMLYSVFMRAHVLFMLYSVFMRAHVLFMLFVFVFSVLCNPVLPVSLDRPFFIAPTVFSNVYLDTHPSLCKSVYFQETEWRVIDYELFYLQL